MDVKALATEIVMKFNREGYIAYFAGGWVRDYLLDHPSADIDIATNAPTQVILDLFPHTILVGLSFGVVIVVIEGHQFEVATFRKDIGYEDGRKPTQIEMSTPREDAIRRDFTINGMFYDPLEDIIYDYVGGTEDLKKCIIRTIGNPNERFVEDRLRMVRAVRFACKFGFSIDNETQEAIIENADTLFPAVAMERIWQEFTKMAMSPRFDSALIMMHRLGLLPVIFPVLRETHLNDIKHRVSSFGDFPVGSPTILYLMELFPNLTLKEKIDICQMLRMSTKDIALVQLRDRWENLLQKDGQIHPVEWVHFYADPNAQLIMEGFSAKMPKMERKALLGEHKRRIETFKIHVERVKEKKPLITGEMLKKEGVLPGIAMGKLLKEAEAIAITEDINDSARVLEKLKTRPIWPKE